MSDSKVSIGPFTVSGANQVQEILDQKGIAYERSDDQNSLAIQEEEWARNPTTARHGAAYQPAYISLVLDRSGYEQVKESLVKFGVVNPPNLQELEAESDEPLPLPDFNEDEEYCCPKCGYSPDVESFGGMGQDQHPELRCVNHDIPLMKVSTLSRSRKKTDVGRDSFIWGAVILLVGLLIVVTVFEMHG
ncbi:MAG: hypothetical protein JNL01_01770 [Bdellovibrionales bacterium]|nr:hypothetical protein [Bdellovibrionales bacterium]